MQRKGSKIQLVVLCDRPFPTTNRSEFSKVQSLCRDGVSKTTLDQDYWIQCGSTAVIIQFSQESLK